MLKQENTPKHWFVMRDLSRSNSKNPAYKQLTDLGMEVFTPLRSCLKIRNGRRVREDIPYIHDLLFVYDTKTHLDIIVSRIPTLQYRYQKGKPYCEPMTVPDAEMNHFINVVNETKNCQFYLPEELTPSMIGKRIRIIGGNMDGYEGCLLRTRGSRTKRILVELSSLIVAAVEVSPEYIQLL